MAEHVRSFSGALNEKNGHRLFVLSADLLDESETNTTPWNTVAGVSDKKLIQQALKFMISVAGKQSDFVLAMDGRSGQNRRTIEDEMNVLNNPSTTSEIWVSYQSSRPGRKVFGASQTREAGYLKSSVARVRLNTVKREDRVDRKQQQLAPPTITPQIN